MKFTYKIKFMRDGHEFGPVTGPSCHTAESAERMGLYHIGKFNYETTNFITIEIYQKLEYFDVFIKRVCFAEHPALVSGRPNFIPIKTGNHA